MAFPAGDDATDPTIEPLRRLLAEVRFRARWWIWVESCGLLALAAVAGFWCTLLFDRWVEPPGWVRGTASCLALAGLGWIIATKLVARLRAPLSDASLALVVERHERRFADSLSTAIALSRRDPAAAGAIPCDPELAARTVARAREIAGGVRTAGLFRRARLAALALAAIGAGATVAGLAVFRSDIAGLWLRRMTLLSDEPWPRRVQLAIEGFTGGRRLVARGSDVEIVVWARSVGPLPEVVEVRSRSGHPAGRMARENPAGRMARDNPAGRMARDTSPAWLARRMGTVGGPTPAGQAFVATFPGIDGDLELEVRGGDARLTDLRLVVAEPPALAALAILYEPPAYLGTGFRPAAASRMVRVPLGSKVRLECSASKPLAGAVISSRAAHPPDAGRAPGSALAPPGAEDPGRSLDNAPPRGAGRGQPAGEGPEAVVAPGERQVLARLPPLDPAGEPPSRIAAEVPAVASELVIALELTDTDGLSNLQPIEFLLAPIQDQLPEVSLRPRGAPAAITPAGRLLFTGSIGDDHGLASAAIEVGRLKGAAAAPGEAAPEGPTLLPLAEVPTGALLVEFTSRAPHEATLAPLGLAPGERLAITAVAEDLCAPSATPRQGRGETWSLEVVTPEQLRTLLEAREILLRRRLESAIDDLAQARDRLAAPAADAAAALDPLAGLAETVARTAGEAVELADAFEMIHLEFASNALATPELEERLLRQIAGPLGVLGRRDLPDLERACRAAAREVAVERTDALLARLRGVLAKMLELESYNQLVERLQAVIRLQERIRADTLEEQKRRARALLERP